MGLSVINTSININMNKLVPLCILLTALLPTVGCKTHTPMVRYHDGTYQVKVEAAAHWRLMADELCKQLSTKTGLRDSAIFIEPLPKDASDFDLAYHRMVKVQLLSQDWKVVDRPEDAPLRTSIETQLVPHGTRNWANANEGARFWEAGLTGDEYWDECYPGFWGNATTFFSDFGYSLAHFFTGDETGFDWQTSTDLIVTAIVRKDGVPSFGHTQIVYVAAKDAPLYMAPNPSSGSDWK